MPVVDTVLVHATRTAALLPGWLDPETLLRALGPYMLIGLCAIVFAECGLLVGFFLPGDSLLFTAGLFVATGLLSTPIWLVCLLLTVCAVLGNVVGYGIGYRAGPALFNRPNSRVFRQEYVDKTHEFFDKYGARAIVLARFVPIVRTFAPIVAGVGKMQYRTFVSYNVVGALLWAVGITTLGYVLGDRVPWVEENLEIAIIIIVGLSFIPIVIEVIRSRREPTPSPEELEAHEEKLIEEGDIPVDE